MKKLLIAGAAVALLAAAPAFAQPGGGPGGHGGPGGGPGGHGGPSGHGGPGGGPGGHGGPGGGPGGHGGPGNWRGGQWFGGRSHEGFSRRDFGHNVWAQRRFNVRPYRRPHGWYYRRWVFGDILPGFFFTRDYWLSDYWLYDLPAPPVGCRWVRYGGDALLVDMSTGEILDVIYGAFY